MHWFNPSSNHLSVNLLNAHIVSKQLLRQLMSGDNFQKCRHLPEVKPEASITDHTLTFFLGRPDPFSISWFYLLCITIQTPGILLQRFLSQADLWLSPDIQCYLPGLNTTIHPSWNCFEYSISSFSSWQYNGQSYYVATICPIIIILILQCRIPDHPLSPRGGGREISQ